MNNDTVAPDWFVRTTALAGSRHIIHVDDCPIHYQSWSRDGHPGILFIPGNGAHSHWWDFIAPYFCDRHAVAAVDLSGTGDSGHRDHYSMELFAREVLAVCEDADLQTGTVLVGHSFGGLVALRAALAAPERIVGAVMIDSPVYPPGGRPARNPENSPIRPRRIYPDFETACARFRLMPPQPFEHDFVLEYIARHSVARLGNGWSWKFDDQLREKMELPDMGEWLEQVGSRIAIVYGERSSICNPATIDYMAGLVDSTTPIIAMPEAHHHLIVERPLATVAILRTLLASWRLGQ